MSARDIEKLLDGPAGYAIAIGAAVVGVLVILNYIKVSGPQTGTNIGTTAGNVVNGLASSLIGPLADWINGDPSGTYVDSQ